MHWCVNINALQRTFSCCFGCFLNQKRPFPLWNVISCFLGRRFPAITAVWQQTATQGRKQDVEREWIEYDFTFKLPLAPLTYIKHSTSAILHLASCDSMHHICNKTFIPYLHVGRNTHFTSDPGPRAYWPGTRSCFFGGGRPPLDFKWRMGTV